MITRKTLLIAAQVISYLIFAVTIFSAYGGYFDPREWTIPAIALLFFPYLAILSILISVVWLACRKYIVGAIGIFMVLACGPTFMDALPMRSSSDPTPGAVTFRLITFNCIHLRDIKNREADSNRAITFLINSGADFICLQELFSVINGDEVPNATESQIDSLFTIYPYRSKEAYREVEFLSKYPIEKVNIDIDRELGYNNWSVFRTSVKGHELTVVNVHLPSYLLSADERKILTELGQRGGAKKSVEEFEGPVMHKMHEAFMHRAHVAQCIAKAVSKLDGPVVVCGDFNDVPGSATYRAFTKEGFIDAYARTGFGHLITYNMHMMYFHIDQILYKGDIKPLYVRKADLDTSDHYPLVTEFEFLP